MAFFDPEQLAKSVASTVQSFTPEQISGYLQANPGLTDAQIAAEMDRFGVSAQQVAQATNLPVAYIQARYNQAALDRYTAGTTDSGQTTTGLTTTGQATPPTDYTSLVTQNYQTLLGRDPDPEGLKYWSNQLSSGALNPANLKGNMLAVAQSADPANAQTYAYRSYLSDKPTVQAHGGDYDVKTLLTLAGQIAPNIGELRGGIFGTTGESVGFSYDQARQILGRNPNSAEQVILDMARELMNRGVTDLNQLKLEDMLVDANVTRVYDESGVPYQYRVSAFNPYIYDEETAGINRELTAEELSKVQSRQVRDEEGNFYTQYYLPGLNVGKVLKTPTQTLGYSSPTSPLSTQIGKTYSGPGMTGYNMIVDPVTGKVKFSTYGEDTGQGQLLSQALMVASFIPGAQPFAAIGNAYLALQSGNTLGALASLSGLTSYSNVTTALNVANAVNQGNVQAAVTALMANPDISSSAGNTMLTETVSLKDVGSAVNLVNAAATGNVGAVLTNAGNLTNSSDLKIAGAAVNVVNALESGNVNALVNAVKTIDNISTTAANSLNDTNTVSTLISNITKSEIGKTGTDNLAESIYVASINSGASEQEALEASKAITNITANAGGDTTLVSNTGDVDTDILSGVTKVDMGEFEGLGDAAKRTAELNTLDISNTQADTLEEATALAANRGYTNFTFGGNTYSVSDKSADLAKSVTNAEIASATNFNDAYNTARAALGPGQVFEWNGKQYSTDTRAENPSLAAASDQIKLADRGLGGGKGTYAGYDESAVKNSLSQIDFSGLDQAQTYGTFDPYLKSAGLGGEYIIVDDKISKQLIQPVVTTVGLVTRGVGGIADWTAGALQSIEVIDKDSGLVKIAKDLKDLSSHQIGDYVLNQEKEFIDRIDKAQGADKINALIEGFKTNPLATVTISVSEFVEEAPSFVGGVLSLVAKAPKIMAYGINAITNMIEAAGAGYNDTKAQALASGKTKQEAHQLAQTSSAAQGALGLVLGSVVEIPMIKRAGEILEGTAKTGVKESATQVGKTVGKEMGTESIEAGGAAALSSYFGTGSVNLNSVLTSAILDPVIAGNVSGTVATVVEISGNKPATTEVIAAATANPEQATNLINTINSTMQPGVDLKQAGADIVTAMTASGMNQQQAESVANTAIAEQILTNINSHGQLNIPDLNVAVGADKFGNAVTLGDFMGGSLTGTGNIAYVAPDVYIGTGADGKSLTVGDLSSLSAFRGGTATTDTVTDQSGTKTTTAVNTNTGATTETTTNPNTGVNTSTVTDQKAGVTTQVTTDTNTNTNTEVKTDTKTNTETTKVTDSNTNTTTQTVVDNNTNTTTTTNTNTNNQVVSEVKVDNNTNTQTTVNTNVDTNTQTTTTVDLNTNRVVSEETTPVTSIKTVDPVKPVEETEETKEEKEKKEKERKKRRLTQGVPAGIGMAGEITGLKPQMLESFVTGEQKLDPLERLREIQQASESEAIMQNIDPRLASILQERMGIAPQTQDLSGLGTLARVLTGSTFDPEKAKKEKEGAYYSYGKEDSIDDILATTQMQGLPYAAGGYVQPLMAQGGMTLPLMAKKGGLPTMAEGREDFRDGKHVAGDGDGQSDDIPAMLADGEFVFPADVVSALGNGSSKAGTDKLYEMMHAIRDRARSTKSKDLPPPALKSPLDYLKSKR
jgi:hypothetical protein